VSPYFVLACICDTLTVCIPVCQSVCLFVCASLMPVSCSVHARGKRCIELANAQRRVSVIDCVCVCLSICLSIYLSIFLSVCLSVCLSMSVFVSQLIFLCDVLSVRLTIMYRARQCPTCSQHLVFFVSTDSVALLRNIRANTRGSTRNCQRKEERQKYREGGDLRGGGFEKSQNEGRRER